MPRSFHKCIPCGRFLALICALAASVILPAAANDLAAASANAGTNVTGNLRVFYVQPRVFEYLFTGAGTGPNSNAAPLLYFRDLTGQTPTVRLGEPLGAYTVANFTPHKTSVFNASVNTNLDMDASTVTLRDAAGSNRVLTANQPLTEPGWMACLVSIHSGGWGHVRSGDALTIEDVDVTVVDVNPTSTIIRANACEFSIPHISTAERKSVLALWDARRKEAESKLALAAQKRQPAANLVEERETPAWTPQPTPGTASVDTTPAYNYGYNGYYPCGYDGYYPIRYEVFPYTCTWPNGQVFSQRILVPAYFEHHHGGDGNWRH